MLRRSIQALTVGLLALAATGCAARARSQAALSARAGAATPGSFQAGYQGQANGAAQGHGGATAPTCCACGCGGPNASTPVHGGYGGTISGPPATPAPPPAPWAPPPIFFGIPLTGAQDVVFVLDRSGSMGDPDAAAPPSSPLAALATIGAQAATALQTAGTSLPVSSAGAWTIPSFSSFGAAMSPQSSKMSAAKSELIGALGSLPDGTRFNIVFFNDTTSSMSPQMVTMGPVQRMNAIAFVHGTQSTGSTAAVPALRNAYSTRPGRVVFLSDGLANQGGDRNQLLAEARLEMRRGVRFDTVGVGTDQDGPLMQSLASESGGIAVRR